VDIQKELKGVYRKVRQVITSPQRFFKEFKEKGKRGAVVYWVVLASLGYLFNYLVQLSKGGKPEAVLFLPLGIVVGFAIMLVFAGLFHLYLKVFGVEGSFEKTLQIYIYSSTPGHLLGWIQPLGIVTSVWQIALLFVGVMEVHKLTRKRALIATGLLLVTVFALVVLASVVFIRILAHLLG